MIDSLLGLAAGSAILGAGLCAIFAFVAACLAVYSSGFQRAVCVVKMQEYIFTASALGCFAYAAKSVLLAQTY